PATSCSRTPSRTSSRAIPSSRRAKLNWQAGPSDMVSLFWFNGAKVKEGRSPGLATNEADGFLWNQGNFYPEEDCLVPCGLHGLWKAEWNHTFSTRLYLDG